MKWIKLYLQFVERVKSMTKTTETFLPGLSTWSLKTCHIPTVGRLQWKFVGLCLFFCVSVTIKKVLQGSTLWMHVTLLNFVCSFHSVYYNMLMSIYWCHSVYVTIWISLCWYQSVDVTLLIKDNRLSNITIAREDLSITKYDRNNSAHLASDIHLKPQILWHLNCCD